MDFTQLFLLELIVARVSGFILFSPLFGRNNINTLVKAGLILVLSIFTLGTVNTPIAEPQNTMQLISALLPEFFIGFVLGFIMQLFFMVVQFGGEVIDVQMGLTMAQMYDPTTQTQMSVTSSYLNVLFVLIFFAQNGHYTLMRIILTSGDIINFGSATISDNITPYVVEIFCTCVVLGVKLAMPILAAELIGLVGMGILMKAIPQINAFVINIDLKVLIGLILLFLLFVPMGEFILEVETQMLNSLRQSLFVLQGA